MTKTLVSIVEVFVVGYEEERLPLRNGWHGSGDAFRPSPFQFGGWVVSKRLDSPLEGGQAGLFTGTARCGCTHYMH